MGETSGAIGVRRFGYNPDVSTTEVEIRSNDINLAYPSTAQNLEALSDSADDDGKSTGTLTLVSATALNFAIADITCNGVLAADTVTVNGLVYTAVSGVKADNTEFSIDTGNNETATDLADSITNDTRTGTLNDVTGTSSTDKVNLTQTVAGAAGNATTLVSSNGTRLALSGATFSEGTDADVATVNGLTYTGVAGVKANDTQFSVDTSDTAAAADLADSINNDTRPPITVPTADVVATSAAGVVTINQDGEIGDGVDIAGTANITASGATLTDVGTGGRTINVIGLDGNYDEISETVFLNGTAVVALTQQFLRVNLVQVVQVGSAEANVGTITVRIASAGAVLMVVEPDEGQSASASLTVPGDKVFSLKEIDFAIGADGGIAVVILIKFWIKLFGTSWRLFGSKVGVNGSNRVPLINDEGELPPRTEIKITAIKLFGVADGRVECGYSYREYDA